MMAIVDLSDSFKKNGERGAVETWIDEANKSLAMGYGGMWGSGSPSFISCGNDISKLLNFERSLDESLEKTAVTGICPYVLNMETKDCFTSLIHLINHHKGVLFYGPGPAALLRRESARP